MNKINNNYTNYFNYSIENNDLEKESKSKLIKLKKELEDDPSKFENMEENKDLETVLFLLDDLDIFKYIFHVLRSNPAVIRKSVKYCPINFMYGSNENRSNKDFILECVSVNVAVINYIHSRVLGEALENDIDFIIKLREYDKEYKYLPRKLKISEKALQSL